MQIAEIIDKLKKYGAVPRLEGDMVKLTGAVENIPSFILDAIRSEKQALIEYLKESHRKMNAVQIPLAAKRTYYPCTAAQRRMWFLCQLDNGSAAYHIVTRLKLGNDIDLALLEEAFRLSVKKHEILRTVFKDIDGAPFLEILDDVPFAINREQPSLDEDLPEPVLFDLDKGPLFHVRLMTPGNKDYEMIFTIHHIISDGWSIQVLMKEVMDNYQRLLRKETQAQEMLKIQYKDYAHWMEQRLAGEWGQRGIGFWQRQFPSAPSVLSLPYDIPRTGTVEFKGATERFSFQRQQYLDMQALCREEKATLFNFLRAVLSILLGRFSQQNEFVIGAPVSGRTHHELADQLGLYVNTLPLAVHIEGNLHFKEFLKEVSASTRDVFEFQDIPLDTIIDKIAVNREVGRHPLFDVIMVFQNPVTTNEPAAWSRLDIHAQGVAKFDLTFNFDYTADGLFYLDIEYATGLFAAYTIKRLFTALQQIIEQVLKTPDIKLNQIDLLTAEKRRELLYERNPLVSDIHTPNILQLLNQAFDQWKNRIAVIFENKKVSYGELNSYSTSLGHRLDIELNGDTELVGLLTARNECTIGIMLGIWRSGRAYVPIDPSYPVQRIRYIIADAGLKVLVIDRQYSALVPDDLKITILFTDELDANTAADNSAVITTDFREKLAYVIYTSGSTGSPKGVGICHRNVIAFLQWAKREFAATPFSILYAATSYCFDLSIFEFFAPLLLGKSIRMLPSALSIPEYAHSEEGLFINTVPSVVHSLQESGMNWDNVTALNIAGEPLSGNMLSGLNIDKIEIRNLYGPTEDTTYSTVYRVTGQLTAAVPIGKPIDDTRLYILDGNHCPVPEGMAGEIYLSGHGVAKGYINQRQLTTERFLNNPFVPGTVMYKTGDIGKWLGDGNVEFIGRADLQVKIRGHRIEPGEIEHTLEQYPLVNRGLVTIFRDGGEFRIAAYYTGLGLIDLVGLQEFCRRQLPSWMIPDCWMQLDAFPLTTNGKIDRSRLPSPELFSQSDSVIEKPSTLLEERLLDIWRELLDKKDIGINQSFFEAGGNSLMAMRLKFLVESRLYKQLSLSELFIHSTIRQQAQLVEQRPQMVMSKIERAKDGPLFPVSHVQERLWVLTRFEEASVAYNMPAVFRINGVLDIPLLKQAFRLSIERHEALRTIFFEEDGRQMQKILTPSAMTFSVLVEDYEDEAAWIQKHVTLPFNAQTGPLIRCAVLRRRSADILLFNVHHLVCDGRSVEILYEEVIEAYRALMSGAVLERPPLSLQYRDFSLWQRKKWQNGFFDEDLHFWKNLFNDGVPVLSLPEDCNRPDIKTYRGASITRTMGAAVLEKISHLQAKSESSLFAVLLAFVNILLKKYANLDDIVVGVPVSGRDHRQLEDQIGFYANTLAIKTHVDATLDFLSFIRVQKDIILEAFVHRELPFSILLDNLDLPRDLSRSPLFDVMVVLQEGSALDGDVAIHPGLHFTRMPVAAKSAKYDLTFTFTLHAGKLVLELEYNSDVFVEDTVNRMTEHLSRIIGQVINDPALKIRDISLLAEEETRMLKEKTDRTAVDYDRSATIVSLFRQAVMQWKNKTALQAGDRKMSYAELDGLSSRLASILVKKYGVKPEMPVLLHFQRGEWMLVAIFAVLKAGAVYVPVDPDYPSARIDYILDDTGGQLLLYDVEPRYPIRANKPDLQCIAITGEELNNWAEDTGESDEHEAAVRPDALAYIIYTSGTTGRPKGVMIEHRNVVRLLFNDEMPYDFNDSDKWVLFHSYCFDVSVWEIFGSLLNGGTLIIPGKETTQNSLVFYDLLLREGITILNQTPTAFRSLVQNNQQRFATEPLASIRWLVFAGEALMPGILKEWKRHMPGCRNINMYGITETTVHVTFKELSEQDIAHNVSNIGLPLPTLSCVVLDKDLQQVPVGVTGELFVGGAGVGRGYWNQPALTNQRFIEDPFHPGQRLYRSGDYARFLASGDIEYIGRRDDQVKIRGHRIELNEIAMALSKLDEVKDAIVLPEKNSSGEPELIAYYIPASDTVTVDILRRKLNEMLPAYMMPSCFLSLAAFPTNSNGKLDRSVLPRPAESGERALAFVPARNTIDTQLIDIWEKILERKNIGIKDNFFDLGGHSLKATRVITSVIELYGIRIDLKNLFMDPTIESLSDHISVLLWATDGTETAMVQGEDLIV
ncbi:hypothetical protein A3860_05095 [Niastella vici]|uniref:Carrier domain-containing protein n=1 Tax=Niastella vici TaxID=1703345 RepID=A0A1V9FS26_9BACT|nr:non-ribosomal peptide synthetase [Niastella vici]OQP61097.1 hypothetical protein A3860_05095 [Niastella vici]